MQLLGTEYCSDDTHDVRACRNARARLVSFKARSAIMLGARLCGHRALNANAVRRALYAFGTKTTKDAFNVSLKIAYLYAFESHAKIITILPALNNIMMMTMLAACPFDGYSFFRINVCVCVRLWRPQDDCCVALCFVVGVAKNTANTFIIHRSAQIARPDGRTDGQRNGAGPSTDTVVWDRNGIECSGGATGGPDIMHTPERSGCARFAHTI